VDKERLQDRAAVDGRYLDLGESLFRWDLRIADQLRGRPSGYLRRFVAPPSDPMQFRRPGCSITYRIGKRISARGALMPAAIEANFLKREFRAMARRAWDLPLDPPNDIHDLEIRCAAPRDLAP
jgi:hypothetical protein